MKKKHIDDLTSLHLLVPTHPHSKHVLFNGLLLHESAVIDGSGYVCSECLHCLEAQRVPSLALANNMWIGQLPLELSILSLAEQILVARYLPCVYLVKMYPKSEHAKHWLDSDAMYMGLNGNISTFPLNASHIAGLVSATVLPPQARVLAAVIGITFVSPRGIKMRELPKLFHVRRARVYDALQWLKNNNPLYQDVIISDNTLSQLPEEGVPDELLSTV
ncbi:hypothetical protein EDD85DRAFT_761524 [Armillaria nabsnona]|nr:hypothetical protein EDD85DRAFT_761524 [Armillaria nabsnona]